ncbi:unnamed protein product [Mytilus coruscus]|uniref:Uncharacterized protein n=1 Tax=Mytilus coruscus TaxID=42192 RepID=A0A6J7ZZH7_MYTCO|nr:unnamed protein product [Mytilus coruscus]
MEENFQQPTSSTEKSVKIPEHLQALTENVSDNLTFSQRSDIGKVISEYADVFVGPDGKLGRTDLVEHSILTETDRPVKVPPRRLPISQREVAAAEIDKMLKNDIIEPSHSPFSAPIVLTRATNSNWLGQWSSDELVTEQKNDAAISHITQWLETHTQKPEVKSTNQEFKLLMRQWQSLKDQNLNPTFSQECVSLLDIEKSRTTPYHPQSDASTSKTVTPPESNLNDRSKDYKGDNCLQTRATNSNWLGQWSSDELVTEQKNDAAISHITQLLETHTQKPEVKSTNQEFKLLMRQWQSLKVSNGRRRVVCPDCL